MKRSVERPKNPKTNATGRSRRGQVNYSDGISKTPLSENKQQLLVASSSHQPATSVHGKPPIPRVIISRISLGQESSGERIKYDQGSPIVQSLSATHSSANEPTTSGTVQREEAGGASSSSQVNGQKGAAKKWKQSSDSATSETTKKSRCNEESQRDMGNLLRPWICSTPKVAVSSKDYSKTLMTWELFQSFRHDVAKLMVNLAGTEESFSPAEITFKGGAALFYCNDEESKSRLTRMLLEGDFLQSRNLKILEEDEIPGSMKMVGFFDSATVQEPEMALKMLGLQNKELDTARWIVKSVRKKNSELELLLEIDGRSFDYLKTHGFCLPFIEARALFMGFKDNWNDQCEELLETNRYINSKAAKYPKRNQFYKQLKEYHCGVLEQESNKSKDKTSSASSYCLKLLQ